MVEEQRESISCLLIAESTQPSFFDDHRFVGIGHLPLIRARFLGEARGLAIIHDGEFTREIARTINSLRKRVVPGARSTFFADGRLQCVRRRPVSVGAIEWWTDHHRGRADKENNG